MLCRQENSQFIRLPACFLCYQSPPSVTSCEESVLSESCFQCDYRRDSCGLLTGQHQENASSPVSAGCLVASCLNKFSGGQKYASPMDSILLDFRRSRYCVVRSLLLCACLINH